MISYADAVDLTASLLIRAGMAEPDARRTGAALATAEAWGIGSHGLMRLPHYLRRCAAGGIDASARLQPRGDAGDGPIASYDGGAGLGHAQVWAAAEEAARRCRTHGIGAVAVGNSSHCGALGYFVIPALAAGYLSLVVSDGPAAMAPWGGHAAVLSTSPIAAGVPCRPDPIVIDMASSAVARGKIAARARSGEPLPDGWAVDAAGEPTTDPAVALLGMLAPLGGAKGFALGLIVEALAAGLAGPALSADVVDMFDPARDAEPQRIGHLVLAFDPVRFDVEASAQARYDDLAARLIAAGGRLPGGTRAPLHGLAGETPLDVPAELLAELRR